MHNGTRESTFYFRLNAGIIGVALSDAARFGRNPSRKGVGETMDFKPKPRNSGLAPRKPKNIRLKLVKSPPQAADAPPGLSQEGALPAPRRAKNSPAKEPALAAFGKQERAKPEQAAKEHLEKAGRGKAKAGKKVEKMHKKAPKRGKTPPPSPLVDVPFASEQEKEACAAFLADIRCRIALREKEKAAMIHDFEKAIAYLIKSGVPASEALRRLDAQNLGGFYSRPSGAWYALDNAAKIYPLSMKHGTMAVFRLSAYLKEPVVPEILQMALTFTIKRFTSFATTVKKGFFWHYLDVTKRRYDVEPDSGVPCSPIYIGRSGSQSFRVLYFENRISVEFFHILTDGTGGMVFLKTLVAEYFRLLGVESSGDGILPINALPDAEETENAFLRVKSDGRASGFMGKAAVQLGGRLAAVRPCRILHFKMDADTLKAAAKAHGATVTAYLLALMFVAGRHATDRIDGEMCVQVPVNMRKFYPSRTLRNFSMYCGIRLPVRDITDPGALVGEIARQLEKKASREAMDEMVRAANQITRVLSFIPLFLKAPVARTVFGYLGDGIFTTTFSNLGVVTLPPELTGRVESMDFVLGTAISNRVSCSMLTVGRAATLTIAKNTPDPSFEEALYALLERDGVAPHVEGSELYEG